MVLSKVVIFSHVDNLFGSIEMCLPQPLS